MSAKIKKVFIFSLLMLHLSMIKAQTEEIGGIDCLGKDFYCTAGNAYLLCLYDEARDTTVTFTDRSEWCASGFCDESNDVPCDNGIDCGGKKYWCPTIYNYQRCAVQPDGTFRTTSKDVTSCPGGNFCDNNGLYECDSLESPPSVSSTTTTETPTTETSTSTEPPTTTSTEPPTTPILGELSGYTCSGTGIFPHPTDCHRYINCYISNSKYLTSQLQCPNDLVYHSELGGCTRDTTPCDNLEFKCEAIGRFADPLNPNKYFWCLKVMGIFQKLKYSCPVGKMYNGVNACVEPIITNTIETFALPEDDLLNLYSTSRRSLSIQNNDEVDDERYVESDEMVADRIDLNSNEDASVYNRAGEAKFRL